MTALAPPSPRIRRSLALWIIVALVALTGAIARPAAADVDDFTFDAFDSDMTLSRAADGHAELSVVETIVARFPDEDQNRGIIRVIPDDYDGVPLQTRVVSVTDASGAPVPYEVEDERREVRVLTGNDDYVRGVQTYVISYTQRDTIRSFADTDADEFYRGVNGTEWAQPFGEVSVRLRLSAELAAATLDGGESCYVGERGSDERCGITRIDEVDGGTAFAAGANDLSPGENVTIDVPFERGTFVPGEVVRTAAEQASVDAAPVLGGLSLGAIGLALAGVVTAVVARRRGRDAAGRGIIVPEYGPPDEVDVLQGAELVQRRSSGIPAALLDAAIAGHLRIVETTGDDTLHLELVSTDHASPLHAEVLTAVFGVGARPGARVELGPDRQDIAKALEKLPARAATQLRERGWTEKQRLGLSATAAIIAPLGFVLAVLALILFSIGTTPAWWQIAAIPATVVIGILAFVLLRYRDRITDAGAPARDHLLGLRDYLRLAEADRLRVLQSPEGAERRPVDAGDPAQVLHLYERLLPWAVVWGVEKEWAEALDTRVRETGGELSWYAGNNGFSSVAFATTLGSMRTASAPVATASASGGSFGGGFSGGGMSGGGGGGR